MSGFDELPPDQRATLKLLLCERLRYADIASSLDIDPRAVEVRAYAALAALAPELAKPLSAEARKRVGDLLLGQLHDEEEIVSAKLQVAASDAETRWAAALTAHLRALPGAQLDVPPLEQARESPPREQARGPLPGTHVEVAPEDEARESPPREQARGPLPGTHVEVAPEDEAPQSPRSRADGEPHRSRLEVSRRGGAALLALLAAAAAAAIFFAVGGGSGGNPTAHKGNAKHEISGSSERSSSSATQTPTLEKQINLTANGGSGSASGVAIVASEEGKRALVLSVEGLPPTEGFVYYLWLVDSTGKTKPHGYEAPSVAATGANKGKISAISLLPKNASAYDRIELTKQQQGTTEKGTKVHPSGPSGEVVLSAAFSP